MTLELFLGGQDYLSLNDLPQVSLACPESPLWGMIWLSDIICYFVWHYAVTTVTIGIEFILARAYPDAIPQPNVANQLPVSPGLEGTPLVRGL